MAFYMVCFSLFFYGRVCSFTVDFHVLWHFHTTCRYYFAYCIVEQGSFGRVRYGKQPNDNVVQAIVAPDSGRSGIAEELQSDLVCAAIRRCFTG